MILLLFILYFIIIFVWPFSKHVGVGAVVRDLHWRGAARRGHARPLHPLAPPVPPFLPFALNIYLCILISSFIGFQELLWGGYFALSSRPVLDLDLLSSSHRGSFASFEGN